MPPNQEVFTDYLNEVKRAKERIDRLEKAIDAGIARAPKHLQELIAALQTLRGVAKIGATTLVTEVGRFSRFESARQLMAYVGVVPSEHSSGGSTHRGSISKTGNARMRHVVGEAAWSYRHRPANGPALKKRQDGQSEDIKAIAWKAQHRLHKRFQRLSAQGKHHGRVVTAAGDHPSITRREPSREGMTLPAGAQRRREVEPVATASGESPFGNASSSDAPEREREKRPIRLDGSLHIK